MVAKRFGNSGVGEMSFSRHEEIYRPMREGPVPGRSSLGHPGPHRYDEFPAGYSLLPQSPPPLHQPTRILRQRKMAVQSKCSEQQTGS